MSTTVVTYPIVMALKEAERILGPDRKWESLNDTQARFLREFFGRCRNETVPEIESRASWNSADVADFLAQRGFPVHVDAFPSNHFGAASVRAAAENGPGVLILARTRADLSHVRLRVIYM